MIARDPGLINLSAILISLAMVIAPHAVHLPTWIPALVAVVLLARFYFGWQQRTLPNKWLLIALALVCMGGIALSYHTLYGRDVGVAMLAVMMGLKVMEMSRPRDMMVVVLLAYFLVVTNFFYSQSIPTALYMLLVVWVITATMIVLQHRAGRPTLIGAMQHAAMMILQGIPIMLALFLLFPRVQGPLWGLPQINYSSKSGLSESMSPGDVSSLSLSDAVAFRVLFEKQPQKPTQFYWRGPVFWNYDGRTWRAGLNLTASESAAQSLGPPLRYTVTMESHDRYWMFAIDVPTTVPQGAYLTTDYQLLSRLVVRERLRYDMQSSPSYRMGLNESPGTLRLAMRLPREVSPRARALAAQWRGQVSSDRDIVARALAFFREQPFVYTLEPPQLGADPVDQFLFETRRGFCEHYASAFTFLMRAAGVPARVVTGYLGGEINPVDGYVIVRQSDAHAWTEVWLRGEGWVRVDPTAAVSPLRVEGGLAAAVPEIDRALLTGASFNWLKKARYAWDAVANSWNQWVLGYSPERQMHLLGQLGFGDLTWQNMVIVLTAVSACIILALSLALLFRANARHSDPVQRAYLSYCDAMAKRGAARRASEGPRDFAARVSLQFPELKETAQKICALYVALRYGQEGDDRNDLDALRNEIRTLRLRTGSLTAGLR
jgi:transglutaminase-like putative cysteine protease